jgi:hypothetical protein
VVLICVVGVSSVCHINNSTHDLLSRPHELQKDLTEEADFQRLCCLARITHKYQFPSIQTWALDTLTTFWKSPRPDHLSPTSWSTSRLVEITDLASLCQHAGLLELMTPFWMKIIEAGDASDLALAIDSAERNGLSSIKGQAYYVLMNLGRSVWDRDGRLTRAQRIRILSGFHDLAMLCNLLPKQQSPNFQHTTCNSAYYTFGRTFYNGNCQQAWAYLWPKLWYYQPLLDSIQSRPADIIGRLSYVSANLQAMHGVLWSQSNIAMLQSCLVPASAAVKAMSEQFSQDLPQYFVDPK